MTLEAIKASKTKTGKRIWKTLTKLQEKGINIAMAKQEQSDGKLELALRILGNEIIGFTMVVDDFKLKCLLGGIAALGIIAYIKARSRTITRGDI